MKTSKITALVSALLALTACSQKISVQGTVKDAPKKSKIVVKQQDVASFNVLDTILTKRGGEFEYKCKIKKGQPEFVYFFYNDRKIASLLLDDAGKVTVEADTLGHYTVSGSKASEELREVEYALSEFNFKLNQLLADPTTTQGQVARLYVDYYRDRVKYVMTNSTSMTVIPVLYQTVGDNTPLFSQATDALHFRAVCDSLTRAYPDSKYIRALEKETARREQQLGFQVKLDTADEQAFPDISLPNIKGERASLGQMQEKVILVYFWDPSDMAQKMYNLDVLLPIYEKFNARGFNIFSVALTPDKVSWGASVRAQKLPWVNVCDSRGAASPVVRAYNISGTPGGILLKDGEIVGPCITGEQDLRRELSKLL